MNAVVQAEDVSRFYGMVLGLNNVSFALKPGLTGIVGPNGAGKTTLFRLILGQIRPSSGRIRVLGAEPWNNPAVAKRLAYCPEGDAVPAGLNARDWLTGLAMLSGRERRAARERAAECLDRVKLAPEHRSKSLAALSKGMRQRVKLAQCLLHDPDLLIFDEPMNGLDPLGRDDFAAVLRDLAGQGKTVLVSSHIVPDLEALCAEFLLLRWGRIPRSLNESLSPEARRAWPAATTFRCADPRQLARFLTDEGLLRGWDLGPEEDRLQVRWAEPERFFGDFHGLLLRSGARIREVRHSETALQQVLEPPAR
ncbi:MAG TPA: ABC transporter ATP-binding protein [Opitutaceae bacterium]|jgi:ABC-2 type transport system ATP-binding protein|nr:ABC transporter ATP-binding protein [Opitutaceae bacterium]